MSSYTLEDVRQHNSKDSIWIVHCHKVYDVTEFANRHPGGAELLVQYAGQDVTSEMNTRLSPETLIKHIHTKYAYNILHQYYIGELCEFSTRKSTTVSMSSKFDVVIP